MSARILDGTGRGYAAAVDSDNRLFVDSQTKSLQHVNAFHRQRVFNIQGEASASVGKVTVLHLANNYEDQALVALYVRLQAVGLSGGSALPSAGNYFQQGYGRTVSTGGAAAAQVNTYIGSTPLASSVVGTQGAPTMTGVDVALDRWRPQSDGQMMIYNKEAALVVGPGRTFEVSFTGDHTSGTLYARVSFIMLPVGG